MRMELDTVGYKPWPAAAGPDTASCCSCVKVMIVPIFSLYLTSWSLTKWQNNYMCIKLGFWINQWELSFCCHSGWVLCIPNTNFKYFRVADINGSAWKEAALSSNSWSSVNLLLVPSICGVNLTESHSLICFSRNHLGWAWGYKNGVDAHIARSWCLMGSQRIACHNGYNPLFPHYQVATSQNCQNIRTTQFFLVCQRKHK